MAEFNTAYFGGLIAKDLRGPFELNIFRRGPGFGAARVFHKFGKLMGLHDFRRAAATFVAMEAPEKIGLIPGVLQHDSPDVSEQHYNLARSMEAGQRFAAHLSEARARLRSISPSSEG